MNTHKKEKMGDKIQIKKLVKVLLYSGYSSKSILKNSNKAMLENRLVEIYEIPVFKRRKNHLRGTNNTFPGYNELPGGKVEPYETIEESAIREVDEEANLTITKNNLKKFPEKFNKDNKAFFESINLEVSAFFCELKKRYEIERSVEHIDTSYLYSKLVTENGKKELTIELKGKQEMIVNSTEDVSNYLRAMGFVPTSSLMIEHFIEKKHIKKIITNPNITPKENYHMVPMHL